MIVLAFVLTGLLFGSLAAHVIPARWRPWIGLALFTPLLLVAFLYWQASRGGCAGGECGPAQMLLALFGLLALVPALVGAAFLLHAMLTGLAGLIGGERARTRGVRWTLTLLPFALASVMAIVAIRAVTGQPSQACRTRTYVATIAGERVRLPFGKEVTVTRERGDPLRLVDLRDARALCATAAPTQATAIAIDHDPFADVTKLPPYGVIRRVFGRAAYRNRTSVCDGVFGTTVRPLICPPPTYGIGYVPDRQQVTIQPATTRFARSYFFPRDRVGTTPAADPDRLPVFERRTVGAFAVEMKDGGWVMREGDTAGDPLGLPRLIAYCRAESNGYAECSVRHRLSARLAAQSSLVIVPARAPADVLPTLARLSAFLATLTSPIR